MNRGQSFLLLEIAAVALATAYIVAPFLEFVIGAVLLAYVLFPLQRRLAGRIGGRAAAISLLFGTLAAVIAPLAYIVSVFVGDLRAIAAGDSDLDTAAIEAGLDRLLGADAEIELTAFLSTAGDQLIRVLFGGYAGVFTFALQAALGTALMLFLIYYLLLDGPAFLRWGADTVPLPPHVTEDLLAKIDATTRGVVVGHISVAILQAVVAGVGLWAVGIPNVVFWTFVMAVLALLPLIGAFLVWGPAAAYLVAIDQVTAGVLLAVYGVAVVSLIDNYLRPIVIDQRARLNPSVILVGVLGGVYAVGFTGLFVGPIVIGVLAATLETFRVEYDRI